MEQEDLEELEIIKFFESDYQEYWLEQMGRTDCEKLKNLVNLIENEQFFSEFGENSEIYLLADGESLISLCAVATSKNQPEVMGGPIHGFGYTFSEYRGQGCMTYLLSQISEQ